MPLYEFQCDSCGVRFEKLFRRITDDPQMKCGECGNPARKLMSACNHTFAHTPVGGPRPQNTGVHSIDYNADRVIGRDAARRWGEIEKTRSYKNSLVRDERKAGRAVSLEHVVRDERVEGNYRIMDQKEVGAVNERRTVAHEATASKGGDKD